MAWISSTGMDVGRNSLSPITADYSAPFAFSGSIERLDIKLLPASQNREDAENWFRSEMSQQ